jgi:hypothetical protein
MKDSLMEIFVGDFIDKLITNKIIIQISTKHYVSKYIDLTMIGGTNTSNEWCFDASQVMNYLFEVKYGET